MPQATDNLAQLVDENWAVLEKAQSQEVVTAFRAIGQLKDFGKYTDAEIWAAVERKRQGGDRDAGDPSDLKTPEWTVFSNPSLGPGEPLLQAPNLSIHLTISPSSSRRSSW